MVLVSEQIPACCLDRLVKSGYTPILLPADKRLAKPVASHPDMLLYIAQDRIITDRFYYENIAHRQLDEVCRACGLPLQCTEEKVSCDYPYDIRFNAARVGKYLFCYPAYTSHAILETARREQLTIIPIRQGYARCSLCPVGDHALITADPSIYRAIHQKNSPDALLVQPGHVSLPGYPHGFIGGCCGADGDRLYFCGDLMRHPDGAAIHAFLNAHGIMPVSLSNEMLFDCGSLFFLPIHASV